MGKRIINKGTGFIVTVDFNLIPGIIARVEANSYSAPAAVAKKIAARARQLAPEDTGDLIASIHVSSISRGKEADIEVFAPYAQYVEYGTSNMAAQPFLTPAFEEYMAEFSLALVKPIYW